MQQQLQLSRVASNVMEKAKKNSISLCNQYLSIDIISYVVFSVNLPK